MKNIKHKIIEYVKETRAEVKKVIWPGRQYVVAATGVIILIVILLAAFVTVLDWGLAKVFLMITGAVG